MDKGITHTHTHTHTCVTSAKCPRNVCPVFEILSPYRTL
jgi:hypothetical protein